MGAMAHKNIIHKCGVFVGLVVHQLPGVEEQVAAHYGVAKVEKLQRIAMGGHTEQEKIIMMRLLPMVHTGPTHP